MTELWKEPAEIVGIAQEGVPYGLAGHITEHGFVLENGTVLLESEKDGNGFYIGGTGMDGMYLRTPERYEPVRDEFGGLTGFRRVSQYVSCFNSQELELIYSYATSPDENLLEQLRMVGQRLKGSSETQALFAGTAEKLGQIPSSEHRRLTADVYAAWKERHMEYLRSRQQNARRAPMAEQLASAAKETAELNANRGPVRTAALGAER